MIHMPYFVVFIKNSTVTNRARDHSVNKCRCKLQNTRFTSSKDKYVEGYIDISCNSSGSFAARLLSACGASQAFVCCCGPGSRRLPGPQQQTEANHKILTPTWYFPPNFLITHGNAQNRSCYYCERDSCFKRHQ
jgi:hypothetical protein